MATQRRFEGFFASAAFADNVPDRVTRHGGSAGATRVGRRSPS
jgi:hypothetical protein